jgi:hypothetical protein
MASALAVWSGPRLEKGPDLGGVKEEKFSQKLFEDELPDHPRPT